LYKATPMEDCQGQAGIVPCHYGHPNRKRGKRMKNSPFPRRNIAKEEASHLGTQIPWKGPGKIAGYREGKATKERRHLKSAILLR